MILRTIAAIAAAAPLSTAHAQDYNDGRAVHQIPQIYAEAWGRGDATTLATLMADDVDVVTASAVLLHGRDAVKSSYSALFANGHRPYNLTPLRLRTRFLSPTFCVLSWTWSLQGDGRDTPPPRTGLTTMLVEKRAGAWRIQVAQDTPAPPGQSPDMPSQARKP
jgi:uncharacterized protein (TIGR02246 family)